MPISARTATIEPDTIGSVVYFPTDNLIVMTSEKHFEKLAGVKPTKIEVSEELQDLSKKMSKGQFWVAVSRKMIPDEFMNGIDEAKKGRVPYAPPELIDAIKDMKGAGFFINVDADTVKFGGGMLGGNKELIEKAETALKKQIEEQRAKKLDDDPLIGKDFAQAPAPVKTFVNDLQKSVAVDRNAAMLEVSASFTISGLEAMIEALIAQQKAEMEIQQEAFKKRMEFDRKKFNIPPPPNFDDLKKSIERKPEDDLDFKVNPIPDPPKK